MKQTVMVLGQGGREHTIAHYLNQSPLIEKVYVYPGNAGMQEPGIECVLDGDLHDQTACLAFAQKQQVAWVFVGPEEPLLAGIVDAFEAAAIPAFGPQQAAARLEGSKSFAKELMTNYQIPTARYETHQTVAGAFAFCEELGYPVVIKADGLAAGKGVVIAETAQMARETLVAFLEQAKFGTSSETVVIEEFLVGEEFSLMSFVSGETIFPMPIAQDHKRAFDHDKGPNTGGMGAYAPVPHIPNSVVQEALQTIVEPTVAAMRKEGLPFNGILYAGLILTEAGPKVIEFNVRFGDPETQVILPLLKNDLAAVIQGLLAGEPIEPIWSSDQTAIGVVVARQGYPTEALSSYPVQLKQPTGELKVFYSGVKAAGKMLYSNGGRVYLVAAIEDDLARAAEKVYHYLSTQPQEGFFYRKDIGFRAKK